MSSSQLAESALSNLRKSLTSQRSPSPVQTPSPPPATKPAKSRLEDRLRAAAASAKTSPARASSPDSSASAPTTNPLSPGSVPLPTSPPPAEPVPPNSISLPTSPSASPSPEAPLQTSFVVDPDTTKVDTNSHGPSNTQQSGFDNAQTTPAVVEALPNDVQQPRTSNTGGELASTTDVEADGSSPEASNVAPEVAAEDIEPSSARPSSPSPEQPIPDTAIPGGESRQDPEGKALQERLAIVEQRFADVSTSFKRLQAEKLATDGVLKEFVSEEGGQSAHRLRDFLHANADKIKLYSDEVQQLTQKLTQQEERLGEMREMHRMESQSQSKEIDKLRGQLQETDVVMQASQDETQRFQAEKNAQAAELQQVRKELENQKNITKEEEEKRVKAISLLKTLRQKSVKADKEKEEAVKELAIVKEQAEQEKRKSDEARSRFQLDLDEANADSENALKGLRSQFDKEISGLKERHNKELTTYKSQAERELITLQNTHSQEVSARNSKISSLENSVRNLVEEKNRFFDQLQICQAELESSQTHLESLRSQNTEFEFQLREAENKLSHEMNNAKELDGYSSTSAQEVASLISTTEAKYQVKVADLKRSIATLERERNEGESEWSRRLREKNKEADELRRVLESTTKTREQSDETLTGLQAQIATLKGDVSRRAEEMLNLQAQIQQLKSERTTVDGSVTEVRTQKRDLEQRVEEMITRETQLRAANKNLKDELRKVQSSAALLEKQRNPGVGYWRNGDQAASRTSLSSASDAPNASPATSPSTAEEQVNLEYLRNVILQFLEHKEMRPNLVKVLSIILQFTPQETRRLTAKI